MSAPPWLVDLTIGRKGHAPRRMWLPVVLLWPLLAVVGLLALVLALLVDAALRAGGRRRERWTALVCAMADALAQTRGLVVRIDRLDRTMYLAVR